MLAPEARSFYEIARGELFLHTRGTATYDSNVFASEDAQDDVLFILNPELEYVRRAGRVDLSVSTGVRIGRFLDLTDEHFENYYAAMSAGYPVSPGSRMGGGVSVEYSQDSTLSETLNERITRERYTGSIDTSYRINERVGLRNSLRYSRTDRTRFIRVERIEGRLGAVYFYSENLDFDLTYRLGRSTSPGTADRERRETIDQGVTVGATGDMTARVSGNASVGFLTRHVVRGEGRGRVRLIFATGLDWAARANTVVSLDGTRDVDLSPEGRTVEGTSVRLGVTQRLTPKMSGDVYTRYRLREFRGVETDRDHTYTAGAGLSYSFTRNWDGSLDYTYTHGDLERRDVVFDRHTVALSTRYTF